MSLLLTSRNLCVLRRVTPSCALFPKSIAALRSSPPPNDGVAALASRRVRDSFLRHHARLTDKLFQRSIQSP